MANSAFAITRAPRFARERMYTLLISFLLVSLLVSFLCSLWEAVLLSITPSYAEVRLQEGSAIGRSLRVFKDNIDRPLAAILTLNTIAHTVGAIGVGAQAAGIWGSADPLMTLLVVPLGTTIAILLFSEIVPARDGLFQEGEQRIINNLLKFESVQVWDIMTPRTVVAAVPEDLSIRDGYSSGRVLRFSRIPTYHQGSKDQITGYVLKDSLLVELVEGRGDVPLGTLRRDILAVDEDAPIPEVFRKLTDEREHIALVLDEFGGMAGIVTMEDIIETLLGFEIVDETDATVDMRLLAQRHRQRRARALGLVDDAQDGAGGTPLEDREAG